MAVEGRQRTAGLLRRPRQRPVPAPVHHLSEAAVATDTVPQVAAYPLPMGPRLATHRELLAQTGNPTSLTGPTIYRQRTHERNPREEPDALADTSGSVRRAPVNHRRAVRTTNLLERLFVEEHLRMKIIAGAIGEKPMLKFIFTAKIQAYER